MNNQNNFNDSKSHHTDNNEINERKISYNKRSNNIDKTIDQIVNNKILDYINELRQDILYLKNINNKDKQSHKENDEEIKQLQIKNEKLIEEMDKIKNELKTLFEENKRNKEEIISLKNIVNYNRTFYCKKLLYKNNNYLYQKKLLHQIEKIYTYLLQI